jgi:hypothetical protein
VIQVTLSFPDQQALVNFFAGQQAGTNRRASDVVEKVEAKKPQSSKAAATPTATVTAPAKVEPAVESPSDPKPVEPTGSSTKPSASVDYPTLQKAVFALAGKSRESAGAVAASFGVKTFKELPEAKWADALVAVNAALAEAA